MNLLEGKITQSGKDLSVVIGDQTLSVPQSVRNERPSLDSFVDKHVIVGIRPEIFYDQAISTAAPDGQRMRVNIELLESLGSEIMLHMRISGQLADTEDTRKAQADNIEDAVLVAAARNEGEHVAIVARVDPRSNLKAGDVAELGVDTQRLHFFDPATSKGIH
jgi:multiple sugar transport system ATP-binding protein